MFYCPHPALTGRSLSFQDHYVLLKMQMSCLIWSENTRILVLNDETGVASFQQQRWECAAIQCRTEDFN